MSKVYSSFWDLPLKVVQFSGYSSSILNDVAEEGLSYQFSVRNRRVDEQGYLQNLLAKEPGEEKLDVYKREYNATIQDNTSVGHNNCYSN